MDKSIIIVGAGIAGLSAGCYARMNGYRTTRGAASSSWVSATCKFVIQILCAADGKAFRASTPRIMTQAT